ncbi:MAG: DUF5615 family PIN-like protein [Flavobacteriales bacterium]
MKFLVDAQLPKVLSGWLVQQGYEAIHTLDLAQGNDTADVEVLEYAWINGYTIITKDSDFLNYFTIKSKPEKLLLLTCGNIPNQQLIELFKINFPSILKELNECRLIELNEKSIVAH